MVDFVFKYSHLPFMGLLLRRRLGLVVAAGAAGFDMLVEFSSQVLNSFGHAHHSPLEPASGGWVAK